MAAANSSTSNQEQHNSDDKFCLNSLTTFIVGKKPPVSSNVGGIVIQDSKGCEKFKLEELPRKEPGLAVKDSDGKLILTVKPEGTNKWKVFPTVESKSVNSTGKKKSEPLFTVKTSGGYSKIEVSLTDYKIEGSFAESIFTISHISRGVAAEVKLNNQLEGTKIDSVYNVEVKTGYDQAFIFGLVAVFEQIQRLTKK